MRHTLKIPALAALLLCSITAAPVHSDEVPTEKEVMEAQGSPPLIPHRIADNEEGKSCLACHEEGVNGAPPTSHPERIACTQCHVPGEVKGANPVGKKE